MVIRVVEFSSRGTNLETFLTKNQKMSITKNDIENSLWASNFVTMLIRVVELSSRSTKLETFLTKNQQSQSQKLTPVIHPSFNYITWPSWTEGQFHRSIVILIKRFKNCCYQNNKKWHRKFTLSVKFCHFLTPPQALQ